MAITVASLNSAMDAAVTALLSGDYATALRQAVAAQGILTVLPELSRSAGTGGGSQAAKWTQPGIDQFVGRVSRLQGASLGVQSVPIEIVKPEVLDDESQFAGTSGGAIQ
jgi:hypothetical protein